MAAQRAVAKSRTLVTYRKPPLICGIILPVVMFSTRRMKGMMDKTLWCDEKGVSQCTARFRIQTARIGKLIGSTQSINNRMEWV